MTGRFLRVAFILLAFQFLPRPALTQPVELSNGMRLYLLPVEGEDLVCSALLIKVGSRNDPKEAIGASHMVEHLLIRGATEKYAEGESEMALRLEGIDLNGETLADFTYIYAVGAADKLDLILSVQAEQFGRLRVTPDALSRESARISSEKNFVASSLIAALTNAVYCAAYSDCEPFRWGKVGLTMTNPNRLTVEGVTSFYKTWYHPNNALLILAGKFDRDAAIAAAKKYFEPIPAGKIPEVKMPQPKQSEERSVTITGVGAGKRLMMVYHVPDIRHPDHPALSLLASILSNRMFRSIGAPGIATNIAAYIDYLTDSPGLFVINATTGMSDLDKIKALIDAEIQKVQRNAPDEVELFQAKVGFRPRLKFFCDPKTLISQGRARGLPFSRLLAQAAINFGRFQLYFGQVEDEYLKRIDAVQAHDVARCAAKYLVPSNRTIGRLELPPEMKRKPAAQ